MQVGEVIIVSFDEYAYHTIRTYATEQGMILGRTYSTQLDRANRSGIVTRKS